MTTENEQITPADAAIVSSGTGTKGPEERDLPASLKEEMDLCLQILREVLGEFDENLLAKFDEVREHALKASDERFSGILSDTNPDQDDLQKVVDIVDKMDVHDAQLLARAFTTYFHLANLCEENYRVSVLHSREAAVNEDQAVDPVNEMTCAYHQLINEMGPARAKELLDQLEFHPVFTIGKVCAQRSPGRVVAQYTLDAFHDQPSEEVLHAAIQSLATMLSALKRSAFLCALAPYEDASPALDDSSWRTLDLPHDFQFEQPWTENGGGARGFKPMCEGWYRKSFPTDPSWKGKRVVLDFGGIIYWGDVYLNGTKIVSTDYGYVGLEADLTPFLRHDGENVVAVYASTGPKKGSR